MKLEDLIQILSDGDFHSGEDLGESLGVSRAAIWKQLKKLEDMNIPVHSVKGKGYRLPEAVQLLDQAKLVENGFPINGFQSCQLALSLDSTNDAMMREAENNQFGRHICFAEMQTSGRGRRGRNWVSPFARNLYFSILWPFSQGIAAIQGLSLAVGLAIHDALKELGIQDIGLKWPNDILAKNNEGKIQAKLGGILIELTGDVTDNCQVVIGVGLNLDIQARDLALIEQDAIGVKQLMAEQGIDRNAVAAKIVKHLYDMLETFSGSDGDAGFAPLAEKWNRANAFEGKDVSLLLPSSAMHGQCVGVNQKGELILSTEEGEQVFNAGEVSLRLSGRD